ncbi:cytochrome-c peroxidase [Sorangium sp. So ce375]|uniref:cytochrome-c peroxidase n=1 Tax=Sorangium sp. So ce375 TaxID=3133306 RepID=UPI003F5BF5E8
MSTSVFSSALTACGPGDPALVAQFDADDPDQRITVTEVPPPAISGGTLIIAGDGHTAVAADPDRDRVWIVDLDGGEPAAVLLERGDEPGRLVQDMSGRVHVALRRAGAVVTLDIEARSVIERREVCRAPRGVAYDATLDAIHVACAGGELVTLPASGGAAVRRLRPASDLRDVVVEGDRLLVSRFKSAETLVVGPDGAVLSRRTLPVFHSNGFANSDYAPSVAWRMAPLAGGGALMVHQRAMSSKVTLNPGGYYQSADCDGNIVHGAVSRIDAADVPDNSVTSLPAAAIAGISLPVDLAVSSDGARVAVAGAGNNIVVSVPIDQLESDAVNNKCRPVVVARPLAGQPVAVAFDGQGEIVVQLREPAALLVLDGRKIDLPGESVRDTGHEMFHRPPNGVSAVACASCHPEGHEDGRTWDFDPVGLRRTQALGGGILKTAPLHWSGDLQDLAGLMGEVFVTRMGGTKPGARRLDLVARYLDSLPAFPASPPEDDAAVARGEVLFHDKKVGCAECHGGPMLTNNRNEDVGKGELLQVPSLIGISGRAPFMHDGCAATLHDRFDPACGGDDHGDVSALTSVQLDDLVAYLESL